MRLVAPTNGRAPVEKLTLANGIPITIALQFSTGKRVASRIPGAPDQIYYTLTDGRGFYADLEVAEMIEKLNLVSREPFTICRYGQRDWEVVRAGHAPTPPAAALPAPRREPQPASPVNGQGHTAAMLYIDDFRAAVDVALAAIEIAKGKGLLISPAFEDVRCIATSLNIQRRAA